MSSRVLKAKAPARSTASKSSLLRSIANHSLEMPTCSNCERHGFSSCRVAPQDSSRCEACVRGNRPGCDVLGPSQAQVDEAGRKFHAADRELEEALDAAEAANRRVRRAQKQRKLLADKVYRMFRRGLQSLEELEKLEAEERAAVPTTTASSEPSSADLHSSEFGAFVLSELQQAEFDRFLADPGVSGEIPEVFSASSQDAC
jgi:hypothetical protein